MPTTKKTSQISQEKTSKKHRINHLFSNNTLHDIPEKLFRRYLFIFAEKILCGFRFIPTHKKEQGELKVSVSPEATRKSIFKVTTLEFLIQV